MGLGVGVGVGVGVGAADGSTVAVTAGVAATTGSFGLGLTLSAMSSTISATPSAAKMAMSSALLRGASRSSGVVETPSLGVPCVNVGDRQKGRLLSANIICCAADEASVYAALQKALSPAFAAQARQAKSPYNGGDTSGRIVRRLEAFVQSPSLGKPKLFYDGSVPGWEKEGSR